MRKWMFGLAAMASLLLAITLAERFAQTPSNDMKGAFPLPPAESIMPWLRIVLEAFCMLTGVSFSYLFARFKHLRDTGQQTVSLVSELKRMFSSTDFYIAVIAAPLAFSVVVVASKGSPLLTSATFAFQNGFFWQRIIPNQPVPLVPASEPQAPAPGPSSRKSA